MIPVFDLDGTLCESKQEVGFDVACELARLIDKGLVVVVSGSDVRVLIKNLVGALPLCNLKNLLLLPLSGAQFWRFDGSWQMVWCASLDVSAKVAIANSFTKCLQKVSFIVPNVKGALEDRECQMTWSALGQNAKLEEKKAWDPTREKREELARLLQELLPPFEVRIGGTTSIDVTRKGVNKGSALLELAKRLLLDTKDFLYVGDALFVGGNDESVMGLMNFVKVEGPGDTLRLMRSWKV